ncbi:MAG TPA: hypothetical protein ENN19_12770 [Chloroflexi bacterium]|nr:hypothetical protein [Chloroflexota bacterium]
MLEENEQLPDWLVELRDQQITQQTEEQDSELTTPPQPDVFAPEQPPAEDDFPGLSIYAEEAAVEDRLEPEVQEPPQPKDALDSLREQMIQAEDEFEAEENFSGPAAFLQPIVKMKPTQRLALAVMFFLEVAIGGCVLLLVTERVAFPF